MNFPTTHWSVLAQATMSGDAAGREALGSLCQAYWRPVADFLRYRGWSEADAEDLTQEFFRSLLVSRGWHRADRARGRFRSFLLGMLMRVLHQARDHSQALKRGGGQLTASLEALAEEGFEPEDFGEESALVFDQSWAHQVMEGALESVATAWESAGKGEAFVALLPFLAGERSSEGPGREGKSYLMAAGELGLTEGAVKSRILRLRQEFREALERQIAVTVSAPHEIAEEMAYLHEVLSAPGFEGNGNEGRWSDDSGRPGNREIPVTAFPEKAEP